MQKLVLETRPLVDAQSKEDYIKGMTHEVNTHKEVVFTNQDPMDKIEQVEDDDANEKEAQHHKLLTANDTKDTSMSVVWSWDTLYLQKQINHTYIKGLWQISSSYWCVLYK